MHRDRRFLLVALALTGAAFLFTACRRGGSGSAAATAVHAPRYRCPMHHQVTSDRPGNCPICGMRLVRIEEDETPSSSTVEGQAPVQMSAEGEQRIGVAVSTVSLRELSVTVNAPGRVAHDPSLYSAILEYQEALKSQTAIADHRSEAAATIRASQLRLRQMGLSDRQIEAVGKPGFDASTLLLGEPGGHVWVYVDVYDFDAGLVKPGQSAEFTSPALPGQRIVGTVKSLDTIVNNETRTLRARVDVPNLRGDLRPEMYLSAKIHATIGTKLAVPESAVLDTGTRQLVYVETAPGRFEPREVRLGREADGFYEVVSGVAEGDRVVTSANFFVDSESKIRGSGQ